MPVKTNSSSNGHNYIDYKNFSEENSELHGYARNILKMLNKDETGTHKKFVQELLNKYSSVERSKTGKYTQDWRAYNQAQQKEKLFLMSVLDELLNYIPFPEKKGVGRNPVKTRDKIFYLAMQSYNIKSSRRCISDLEIARRMGYIEKTPHFNTVLKCMKDETLVAYFKHLVQVSGFPLQAIETDFAVDGSGFSTSEFGRWLDVRTGSREQKRKFVKVHITCGTRTNIITAVNITKSYRHDTTEFEGLIRETDKLYNLKEVSADKAYSSRKNMQIVSELGAIPFIPFKKNVSRNTKSKNADIWRKMYKFFIDYPTEFNHHYHKRSNVETCFHMIKKKFGKNLRGRSETGQANEILAKCLCHNICVLIQEALEIGIELDFEKCAKVEIAHN